MFVTNAEVVIYVGNFAWRKYSKIDDISPKLRTNSLQVFEFSTVDFSLDTSFDTFLRLFNPVHISGRIYFYPIYAQD